MYFTKSIIILQIFAFVASRNGRQFNKWCYPTVPFTGYFSKGAFLQVGESSLASYIYYAFSHYGVTHLIGNVIATAFHGSDMELAHGALKTAAVWLAGAFGSPILHRIISGRKNTRVVGSSGALYALIGCRLANIFVNSHRMGVFELCARLFVSLSFVFVELTRSDFNNGTHAIHRYGAAAGAFAGFFLFT